MKKMTTTARKEPLRELSLFAGAGGGLLASLLLGWRTMHAVEIDSYRRMVLNLRQHEGYLDRFEISRDIKEFDGTPWRGKVDIVSGGFPCQPFSSAARGRHTAEDLWPEMRRIIGECLPRYVFAENVQREPIERAGRDLLNAGFRTARYCMLSAATLGAPHDRQRWWLVADTNGKSKSRRPEYVEVASSPAPKSLDWWRDDTEALGAVDGLPYRMDRLRALGDAQVSFVAAWAWSLLSGRFAQT